MLKLKTTEEYRTDSEIGSKRSNGTISCGSQRKRI